VKSVDAILLELYDELVIAIRCSRLFTGERSAAAGVTTVRDLGDIRYAAVAGLPVRI